MGNIPSKEELKAYIEKNKAAKLGKNKIADAFNIMRIRDRKAVKELIGQLEQEGVYESPSGAPPRNSVPSKAPASRPAPSKSFSKAGPRKAKAEDKIPKMTVIRVTKVGPDKKIIGQFAHVDVSTPVVIDGSQIGGVLEEGMFIMAKIGEPKDGVYPAVAIRIVEDGSEKLIGVITNTVEGYPICQYPTKRTG